MRSPCRKHPVDACETRVSIAWGKVTAMRRVLLAAVIAVLGTASVQAADLAAHYAKAPMMATAYSWTGFYVGGNVGGQWGSANAANTPLDPPLTYIATSSVPV